MSNYRKTMTEALREMYPLDESVIDKVKEIASKKQAKKIGGVMVDSFTASAISQIYDKVNDANKKKMDSLPITKLANLAFKMMQKNEFVPEEVDLDETQLDEGTIDKVKEIASKKQAKKIDGVMVDSFTASAISQIYDKVNDANKKKMEKLPITKLANLAFKMMQKNDYVPEEVGLDEADDFKPHMMYDPKTGKGYKADTMDDHLRMKKMGYNHDAPKTEEVDLDEGKMQDMWQKKNAQSLSVGPFELLRGKSGVHTIKRSGKVLGDFSYDSDADNFVANMKGMRGQWTGNDIDSLFTHLQKVHKEEVDLDEKVKEYKGVAYFKTRKDAEEHMKKFASKGRVVEYERGYAVQTRTSGPYLNKAGKTEEFELDEGKMSQLHQYIKDKKSPEEIAKLMKVDVKTIKALMNSHHPEEVEESAASDARRAMRRDKDFSRRDSADDDTDATADDIKGASKNIIMQLRKAGNRASMGVEFGDGKKVQIPAKMAIAVQQKYNSMKRPAEKEKFQAKIGKSYKDMLSALKEAVSPAQQAAIAISKKERGEKPKKESVLDRIDRKIKEKNDG